MPRTTKGKQEAKEDAGDSTAESEDSPNGASSTLTEEELLARFEGVATITPVDNLHGIVSEPVPVDEFLKTLENAPTVAVGPTKDTFVELEGLPITESFLKQEPMKIGDYPVADTGMVVPPKQRLPFDDITDPEVLFVINEWGDLPHDRVLIRTHVESFTIRSIVKRADYNDQIEYEEVFTPVNLPCNFIVDHVREKIAETSSDLGILSDIIRRASRELDLTITAVIQDRLDDKQVKARKRAANGTVGGGVRLGTETEVEL